MITKSGLAIELSKLEGFYSPKVSHEQYSTDSEIASEWLWNAFMLGDINDRKIIDQGSGTGILGIACMLLGAKEVVFIESEDSVMNVAKENVKNVRKLEKEGLEHVKTIFSNIRVEEHEHKAEIVIQNPPFGTRLKGADIIFLKKAFKSAPIVYSMHKTSTKEFIQKVSSSEGFKITHSWSYKMPLKATYEHHSKKIQIIDVDVHRFNKI
ncbi:RsmD family RNA methyltransferase [Candidatus Woesearchaeota archaeon]|nr:RsmD family RNA methyltransferase [Candidatus Woesearchaeota archaeon]